MLQYKGDECIMKSSTKEIEKSPRFEQLQCDLVSLNLSAQKSHSNLQQPIWVIAVTLTSTHPEPFVRREWLEQAPPVALLPLGNPGPGAGGRPSCHSPAQPLPTRVPEAWLACWKKP